MKKENNNNTLYKDSPLGKIPVDWEKITFGEVFLFLKSFSFSRDQLTYNITNDEILYIHYGDIHATYKNELLDFDKEKNVPFLKDGYIDVKNFIDMNFPSLKDGDLIIADASEDYDGICNCIELKNIHKRKLISGLHTFAARGDINKIALGFRTYVLNNTQVVRELHRIATGISVYSVSKTNLSKVKLFLPPLSEQKAIAQVLSTADAAIHTIEKLIAQKELRKKWLMQQLLTGKKRLLNDELGIMNYEWKPIRIGDVFKFIKSYSISREGLQNDDMGSVYCIHYGDIHAKYDSSFLDFEIQKNIPQLIDDSISIDESNYLQDGDIIMADASEDYEGVGAAVEIKNLKGKKAIGGLHTLVLRADRKTISPDFAAYFFSSETVRNTLRKYATGTSVYSVTKTQIHNLSFIIPNSLKEQTAIAQVLQAADKEIQLLKTKLEKLKEQKKGLMQQLLTGKKRLEIKEEEGKCI